jgi:hypothetical protein
MILPVDAMRRIPGIRDANDPSTAINGPGRRAATADLL